MDRILWNGLLIPQGSGQVGGGARGRCWWEWHCVGVSGWSQWLMVVAPPPLGWEEGEEWSHGNCSFLCFAHHDTRPSGRDCPVHQ